MIQQELEKISQTIAFSFEDVKWLYDNLPIEYRNETKIVATFNFLSTNGLGLQYLKDMKTYDQNKYVSMFITSIK